jgi:beta-N-acetylhexosaminidase
MVFFTDVRTVYQCDGCPPSANISTNALANALVNLYGPQAGGQILQNLLASHTFSQLADLLDNIESDTTDLVESNLSGADWVVFNTLDINSQYPASNVLQRILAERPDLLSGKNVIVFALGSPTYLDATDISKVTAYYALYSKTPAFLEVAARVLMQEVDPPGALPVSLNAVGYDLNWMTLPNPNQVIRLALVFPDEDETQEENGAAEENGDAEPDQETEEPTPMVTQTVEATPLPSFNVGDTITIRTSQILDRNLNVVPDGTIVRFNFRISGEPGITQQFESPTTGGVAYFNYRIEAAGGMEITATSEPATQSETLQINISPEGIMSIFAFTPTPMVSPTPMPSVTPTPTQRPTPTSTPEPPILISYPTVGEWALGVLVMGIGGVMTFMVGYFWWGSSRWGLRSALCAMIGGLLSYALLNSGLDGIKYWMGRSGTVFVIEVVVVGLLFGWIGALVWWMRTEGRYPSRAR